MPELTPIYPEGDTRGAIVEAALTVFADVGYHAASTRRMAAAAGVSQPLLHHHFGNKDALWRLVGERITDDFLAFMGSAVDPALPPDEAIAAMLAAYLAFWSARPLAFRFLRWQRLEGITDARQARSARITGPVVALFAEAQARGLIRSDLPAGLAAIFSGGLVQFWLDNRIEVRAALAATGEEAMSDAEGLDHILALLRPPPAPA